MRMSSAHSNSLISSTFAELILFLLFILLIYLSEIVTERASDQTTIILSEAEGYSFEFGKSDLDADFCAALSGEIADAILSVSDQFYWDKVEVTVIGHTDLVPIRNRRPYLDEISSWTDDGDSADFRYGACSSASKQVKATNNLGLGFLRAVRVAGVLEVTLPRERFTFVAVSAGQFYPPQGNRFVNSDDPSRRRIELSISKGSR